MALTSQVEINGQQASNTTTYCYLYEPFRVIINESDSSATQIYVRLKASRTNFAGMFDDNIAEYAVYDLSNTGVVSIDLMKIAQQYHNANLYKFSDVEDLSSTSTNTADTKGWHAFVSRYRYTFYITSDVSTSPLTIAKLPIIGGRTFEEYVPSVYMSNEVTEAGLYDITLSGRWKTFPNITSTLVSPAAQNATPSVVVDWETQGCVPPGGMLIWKSRFGGWMYWGFDLKKYQQMRNYNGSIPVGMFESDGPVGKPYIPVDYTSIDTNYKISLKALSLTQDELKAVQGIMASPAVYYMPYGIGSAAGGRGLEEPFPMELVRVASASAPFNSRANGGDFSVTLTNISKTSQTVR